MRGISLRQVRLASGVVLFAYLVSHFLNHALGNISLEALSAGVSWHLAFWQFLPVTILFYTACVVHTALGIWALYERRQFRWKAIEPLQLVLGLSVPMLIIGHVIGIRLGQTLYGHERLYPQVLFLYWIWAPYRVWMMLAVMTIAWVHGCIGLYFWLRMRAFYKRAAPFLLALAVLIPALAMLGFYQSGRMVIEADSMEWRAETQSESQIGTRAEARTLERITDYFLYGYFGLIGIALLARGARAINERRRGMINLSYGNGRTVRVPKGLSVLEASLRNNVPHASVCGGRPNQFVGDGMLALFGLSTTRQQACRQALRAAAMIGANIDELNKFLEHDLREPIRFGIGINGGEVIVGDIGYRDHMVFTALGDPVNVAARLQDMTKSLGCELVVSDEVRATAGLAEDALPAQEVAIRGRNEPMIVRTATDVRTLSTLVDEQQSAAA
jgi:hypothetical protein